MKNLEHDSTQPWLDMLSQFRKNDPNALDIDEMGRAKADGGRKLDIDKADITLFAKLVARDCYLLSYQKLKSRVSSCDALTNAFKFLAFIGSEHDDPTDETNLIRNTVLRQVAEAWPSIKARLKTLSEEVLALNSINNSSVVLVLSQSKIKAQGRTSKSEDVGVQRIFLAKLFELIAIMCECSGDFFADRFRHDVWPVMACHLEFMLKQLQQQRDSHLVPRAVILRRVEHELPLSKTTNATFKMSDTERQLIASILTCLNRIIGQKECGKAVEKLLSSVGFTLLPLLDIEGHVDIQELALDCIRSIMRIDCDVLRRPLMELNGTRIPLCHVKFENKEIAPLVTKNVLFPVSARNKTIMRRCSDLLNFANSLPEQSIS